MKEPVDHILRPRLPWRTDDGAITECGYDAAKVKTLTRDEVNARLKEYGEQRTAILTCMTCMDTAKRWGNWEESPGQALEREIQWEFRGQYTREERGRRLFFELQAIAELIARHRSEFDGIVTQLQGTEAWCVTKADKQQQRIKKAKKW